MERENAKEKKEERGVGTKGGDKKPPNLPLSPSSRVLALLQPCGTCGHACSFLPQPFPPRCFSPCLRHHFAEAVQCPLLRKALLD